MITLLIGKKGSGKTKKLIASAEKALSTSNGNVVVLEKGQKLTYEISHKARLIDTDAYNIFGENAMFGFISGICAGNYDVTDILVDSTLKIIGTDVTDLENFVKDLFVLSETAHAKITLSISAEKSEIPEVLYDYIEE